MPPTGMHLSHLARRLARKETELQRLRRSYERRLTKLQDRRASLADQLRKLDAEIQAGPQNGSEAAVPAPAAAAPRTGGTRKGRLKLADFIVILIKEAGDALTVKQMATEMKRRRYPTKSRNLAGVIQTRAVEMTKEGILERAKDRRGYVLTSAAAHHVVSPDTNGHPAPAAKGAKRKKRRVRQAPLREVLTKILEGAKEPIGGGELAKKALAAGYKTTSESFRDVVWVNLGQMKNVEHVHGKGYRLKNR